MTDAGPTSSPDAPADDRRGLRSPRSAVLEIAAGGATGQVLQLLAVPIVTALFAPEAFGLAAVITSTASLISPVLTLNIEQAIPVPGSDAEARDLVRSALRLLAASVVVVGVGLTAVVAATDVDPLFIFGVPLIGGTMNLYLVGANWATRREDYRAIALAGVNRGVLTPSAQILGGMISSSPVWLIIASAVRAGAGTIRFGHRSIEDLGLVLRRRSEGTGAFHSYRRFATLGLPARLLSSANLQLLPLLVAAMYGTAVAGFYALAVRVVDAPIRTIANATGRVLAGRVAALQRSGTPGLHRLVRRLVLVYGAAGAASAVAIWFLAPVVIPEVTPSEWHEAADYARALAPLIGIRLMYLPLTRVIPILELFEMSIAINILRLGALVLAFAGFWVLDVEPLVAVTIYAGWMAVFYTVVTAYVVRRVGRWERERVHDA